jgi:hypothetical protein
VALDLPLRDPLEPVGLASLPLDEHHVEPCPDVVLGPLDRLRDRRLAAAEPLRDLVDRAPPFHRLHFELVQRLRHGLAGGALELLAQPEDGLALLVGRGAELRGLGLEPGLDLGERLAVALSEVRELRLEMALCPVEILREAAQPLLEPALRGRKLVREGIGHPPLALHVLVAPLLADAALLGGKVRRGLGPLACDHPADLLVVRERLRLHGLPDLRPCVRDELLGGDRRVPRSPERTPEYGDEEEGDGEARAENPEGHRADARWPSGPTATNRYG